MFANAKKLITVMLSCLLIAMFAFTPAMAQPAQAKNMKKNKERIVFQGQQFFLAGVGDLAVELRLFNGKLGALHFWNNAKQPVVVDVSHEKFIVPANGFHQMKVKPLNKFLVTVKPYDPTMDNNTSRFFPGHEFYFVKSKDAPTYDMYAVYHPGDPTMNGSKKENADTAKKQ